MTTPRSGAADVQVPNRTQVVVAGGGPVPADPAPVLSPHQDDAPVRSTIVERHGAPYVQNERHG